MAGDLGITLECIAAAEPSADMPLRTMCVPVGLADPGAEAVADLGARLHVPRVEPMGVLHLATCIKHRATLAQARLLFLPNAYPLQLATPLSG